MVDNLDRLLRRLFRRFEALCISMDHGIVNEATCREYLFSLLLTLFGSSRQFIEKSDPGARSRASSSSSKSTPPGGRSCSGAIEVIAHKSDV